MRGLVPCLFATGVLATSQGIPPPSEVRRQVLSDLRALPDLVCAEIVEQWRRPPREKVFDMVERFRVEVAYVGGKELYGWPDGDRLLDEEIGRLIGGTVASGDFAALAQSVFSSPNNVIDAGRAEARNGRAGWLYPFRVPVGGGDWKLDKSGLEASVGFHGSFWISREGSTLAFQAEADALPSSFGLRSLERSLEYTGTSLLPRRAILFATHRNGEQSRSEIQFRSCRRYSVATSVSFDDPIFTGAAAVSGPPVSLPADFEVAIGLETEIDSDRDAVGDPVRARLLEDVSSGGVVALPKDTALRGRISRLPLLDGHRYVDFRFLYFDANGARVDIQNRRNEVLVRDDRLFKGLGAVPAPIPGNGSRERLPSGYRLILKSGR